MKKLIVLCLAFAMCLSLTACGNNEPSEEWEQAEEWPTRGLGSILPIPDSTNIHIGYNLDDSFSADIKDATEKDFISYIEKCESAGFTVDVYEDATEYTAFNTDGYKVDLSYYDSLESVSIMLDAPKATGTFIWPVIGLATLLPTPNTNIGTIGIDNHDHFSAYIGETTLDDYNSYVNQCAALGFYVDYNKYEKSYDADNSDGVSLRLEYEGFNTMYISMYAPDDYEIPAETAVTEIITPTIVETDPPIIETEPVETQTVESTALIDGMRPKFKESLDSYEDFFEEYCEFMKKYTENPTDLGLLLDYAKFMSQYAETMSKFEALENDEMNDAELLYYLEVSNRISQMLMEVSLSIT